MQADFLSVFTFGGVVIAVVISFLVGFFLGWRIAVKRILSENRDISTFVEQ